MVTIQKDGSFLSVTKGAFNALFKLQGWEEVENSNLSSKKPAVKAKHMPEVKPSSEIKPEAQEDTKSIPFNPWKIVSGKNDCADEEEIEEDEDDESYDEKPLSEMTIEELKDYAEENGIELGKASKKEDIKSIIAKVMMEE